MTRHVFTVERPDGTTTDVEKWAETRVSALSLVRVWVAFHWPGARVRGEPAYEVQLVERKP